ncbi:hypothetical protein [Streptomyces sp. NPDC058280]|uniref:hypothetical protein n=1 Tax=Streptomyces sp. NPDC058280 TaxID=3346419 RepID=UPI0036EEA4E7
MPTLDFHPDDTAENETPEHDSCQCPPGDDRFLLDVDEGRASLVHAACGKQPPHQWGDWQDLVCMEPIPVTVKWERDCDGSLWHGDHMCDCAPWIEATAATVPEDNESAAKTEDAT